MFYASFKRILAGFAGAAALSLGGPAPSASAGMLIDHQPGSLYLGLGGFPFSR